MKLVSLCLAAAMFVGCGAEKKKKADVDRQPGFIGNTALGVRNSCTASNGLTLTGQQTETTVYHYIFQNIPICSWYGRTLNLSASDVFSGQLEKNLESLTTAEDLDWPSSDSVASFVAQESKIDSFDSVTTNKCWYVTPEFELLPAFDVTIVTKDRTVKAVAGNNQIFEVGTGGFDIGRLSYEIEGSGGSVGTFETDSLDNSGFVSGNNFEVFTADGSTRATSESGIFDFSRTDSFFAQASAYANAELMLGWFKSLTSNSVDTECFPIDIRLHYVFPGGVVNNARYIPDVSTSTGRPEILVGDGDGVRLTNLSTDPDVISHEFAHHVIYRGVKDTNHFESVVIHEGFADYFVYSKTGNSCLAETACPLGSFDCVQARCLRNGSNSMSFSDPKLASSPHGQGQIISAMLLDLSNEIEGDSESPFVSTVAASVKYLLPRSSLADMVQALMLADRDLNGGKYACDIYDAAVNRGLGSRIGQLNCADFVNQK
jgi:hypothetical protein